MNYQSADRDDQPYQAENKELFNHPSGDGASVAKALEARDHRPYREENSYGFEFLPGDR